MHIGKKDKDEKSDKRKTLEEQVDAMLDPKRADESGKKPTKPKVNAVSTAAEPASTAPELSNDLRKKIGIGDADTKPLSIDKLDEITSKISAPGGDEAQEESKTKVKPEEPAETSGDAEPAPQQDLDEGAADLDDARTDEAVDDIVSHEGDVMLAVEDATRKKLNPELAAPKAKHKKGEHHILATIMWTLVAFVTIVAVLFLILLITGGDVTAV